ncbi:Ferritin-like protein [Glarea lozoyensis ATCC 20868]|uniref:5-demethoxyubiquinone hydroxylase, mitochondrial n=1 Tax=Glarea lozoyensis (strain ATCC 20868 / MF5171) TaxID=1116229 RepID=S3CQ19_GLAL2|nr:Ferritin-like protein [Glarea lozoyensis ATCC 20868]EPE28587.1 Ferritin-like protein [Glarea lozoyensis ATCC 20868]
MKLSIGSRSTRASLQTPLYDFLAPSLIITPRTRKHFSTTPRTLSATTHNESSKPPLSQPHRTPKAGPEAATNTAPPSKPLTQAQRDFLTSALRVNQAGELAATLIYTAQTPPIVASHPHLRPLMAHMYEQEAGHFKTFNGLLAKHRIRPTAMYPLWSVAATALGWGTAIMGREAAMACTEAVETEIGGHYNGQVRVLLDMIDSMESKGQEVGEDLRELVDSIRKIRDEELEHLDHAVENDAQKAVPHELLTGVIRAGCRGAIWVSERV